MRGYWRRPEESARALDADGWLYTEDMGFLDAHGYLHLIGREKDMYFRAAFNVYPGEVEDVLQHHPKVAQAAVLGVPDDVLGEKGWAFVVPVDLTDRRRAGQLQTPRRPHHRRRAADQRHVQSRQARPARPMERRRPAERLVRLRSMVCHAGVSWWCEYLRGMR
jgi:acyl-CoA synthetase (AMP-forming)/AMP-acid ligase II